MKQSILSTILKDSLSSYNKVKKKKSIRHNYANTSH